MMLLLTKLLLIAAITAAIFRLIAWLLSLSDGWLMQMLALLVWVLVAMPAVYIVWRLGVRDAAK